MGKVCNLFHLRKVEGDYGIEIEVEGRHLPMADGDWWVSHQDGSLRGEYPHESHEYVLNQPIKFGDVHEALTVLNKRFEDNGSVLNFSFRTSVHVHRNVTEFDEVQLLNLIYLYALLENPLVNFCGENRKDNRFCLRVMDADGILDIISPLFLHGVGELGNYPEDRIRYAALNLASVRKYGSVEFRAMRGTADIGTLMTWVSFIEAMSNYARRPKMTPVKIREKFKELSAKDFIVEVMGEELAASLVYESMEFEMNLAHSLTIDLPFFFQRSAYAVNKDERKKAVRKVEPMPLNEAPRADRLFQQFLAERPPMVFVDELVNQPLR